MAKLIKSGKTSDSAVKTIAINRLHDTTQVEKSSIEQAKQDAEQIVNEAQQKAEKLLKETEQSIYDKRRKLEQEESELESKVSKALREAKETGYREGFENGRRQGEEAIRTDVEKARLTVEASKNDYVEKLKEAEPTLIKMAFKIAKKVIGQAVENEPDYWTSLIKTALEEVKEHEDIRIYVHPAKYDMTIQKRKELQAVLNEAMELYIYPDQELVSDGCFIETSFGTIDATIDSQLSEIKAQLLEYSEEREQ